MFKLLVLLCILFALSGTNASDLPKDVQVDVLTPQEMPAFLKKYPNAVKMQRVDAVPEVNSDSATPRVWLITYVVGDRVFGDTTAAYDYSAVRYNEKKDIEMRVQYPKVGENGMIVSNVRIITRQDEYNGGCYIYGGGIGQRFIKLAVLAYQTKIFEADTFVYGY